MRHEVYVSDAGTQALLERLAEAEETLRAIRDGEIDGLVVNTPDGERIFTLKGAEHPYRVMVEAMEEGAASLNADGTILYCNRRFATMLHMPYEHVLGASIAQLLTPESQGILAAQIAKCCQDSTRCELDFQAQDGTIVPVSIACSALPEGERVCLVATDLTARKAAEATIRQQNEELERRVQERTAELLQANTALREEMTARKQAELERERLLTEVQHQAAELDATLNAIADGLLIYDRAGRVVRTNAAAEQMMQYQSSERDLAIPERLDALHITKADGTHFTPEETPAMRALRGEALIGAIMVIHRPHRTIWTTVSAAPICIADNIVGAVVIITDITRQHELQEEMQTFVHMISHDLRTPLTVMQGHANLLLEALHQAEDSRLRTSASSL